MINEEPGKSAKEKKIQVVYTHSRNLASNVGGTCTWDYTESTCVITCHPRLARVLGRTPEPAFQDPAGMFLQRPARSRGVCAHERSPRQQHGTHMLARALAGASRSSRRTHEWRQVRPKRLCLACCEARASRTVHSESPNSESPDFGHPPELVISGTAERPWSWKSSVEHPTAVLYSDKKAKASNYNNPDIRTIQTKADATKRED